MMRLAKMEGKPIHIKARKKTPRDFSARAGMLLLVKNAGSLDERSHFSNDSETQIGGISIVLTQAKPKNGETEESRNIQESQSS